MRGDDSIRGRNAFYRLQKRLPGLIRRLRLEYLLEQGQLWGQLPLF